MSFSKEETKMLSKRVQKLTPSAVMALGARAQKLKNQGVDVISLSLGEPTWDTPESICSAGIQAIKEGYTKYTPASGSQKLKEAIATNTKKWLGLTVTPSQITVSIGAKFILFSAVQSLCDPEDEVLIPTPYWVSYPSMVELAQAHLVSIPTRVEENFKLKPETLKKYITKKSKVLILNSPNNPSGAVFSANEWKSLAEVLMEHPQLYILSDDIYNHLYFLDPIAPHLLQVCPDLKDRVLSINAVSKNYSMPGWRVGWAVGNEEIIGAMSKFQSQSVSCASSISQEASAYALVQCDKELEETRQSLIKIKDIALKSFQQIPELNVFPPEGAFYLWVGVEKLYGSSWQKGTIRSSADFVEALFQEKSVLCVPGEEFNYPGYVRIHFAVDENRLTSACSRIRDFISYLS